MRPEELSALLESPEYADFLKGSEELSRLHSLPELEALNSLIEKSDSDHLRGLFQNHVLRLFKSELMEANGFALRILLEQASLSQKEIRTEAMLLLEEFLSSDDYTYFKKLISFRRSFRELSVKAKKLATRLIGTYHLREAHSLILENLRSKDNELIYLTIEIFRRSKDPRGNRYIREIIDEESDERLVLKALEAMSELGHFFDQGLFKKHLRSPKIELRKAALRGLYRLRGDKSLKLLLKEFLQESSPEIRNFILDLLASSNGSSEVDLLLQIWMSNVTEKEDRQIEWLLGEIDNQVKLEPILKAFKRSPESTKHKLIVLLNEISSLRCYEFYKRALFEEKNPFLLMSVMEAIAYYDRIESIPLLQSFMKDSENFLHYYAFSSIVRHSCLDLTEILEEVALLKLPDDRHHHQLILSVLAHQNSLTTLTTFLQAYVLLMLRSERSENRYLAYMVVGKFYLLFELKGIFGIFKEEKSELVLEEGRRVFGEIFARAPRAFMEANPPKSIFEAEAFARGIDPTPSLLLSLFSSKEEVLVRSVAHAHPLKFQESVLEIAQADLLEREALGWFDLWTLNFREFRLLWEKLPRDASERRILLEAVAIEKNPKIGEYLLEEFLERGGDELRPFINRYVEALP